MLMKLSKKIPARTKTVEFWWAYKYFMQCTDRYREIREEVKRGGRKATMLKCDWCKHEFEKDEYFAVANPKPGQEGPKRNWALCHGCADLMGAPNRKNAKGSKNES